MKIDNSHELAYENDYFIITEIGINKEGKSRAISRKTYPSLLDAHSAFTADGRSGKKLLEAGELLLKQHKRDVYQWYLNKKGKE